MPHLILITIRCQGRVGLEVGGIQEVSFRSFEVLELSSDRVTPKATSPPVTPVAPVGPIDHPHPWSDHQRNTKMGFLCSVKRMLTPA